MVNVVNWGLITIRLRTILNVLIATMSIGPMVLIFFSVNVQSAKVVLLGLISNCLGVIN